MALLMWNWDDFSYYYQIDIDEICHTIEHPYGGGYAASRPEASKMQKCFYVDMLAMNPAQWLNFVVFWRAVHGNADAWYFQIPYEIYGSPGYGGYGGLEPADGFDADQAVGYGEGPIFTCQFVGKKLPQKYRSDRPNHWRVTATIREVI